tara:strand:+ start:14382 stop:14813 length:432 start_codon:yes stop_codon:yes gene_type:complete
MAASDATDAAFEAHFAENFDGVRAVFENDADPEITGRDPWVYIENESDEDDQASLGAGSASGHGDNLMRETGRVGFYVLVPIGSGRKAARQLRDQIVAAFAAQDIGPVTCRAAHRVSGYAWDGVHANGNWQAFPVLIDWYRDY